MHEAGEKPCTAGASSSYFSSSLMQLGWLEYLDNAAANGLSAGGRFLSYNVPDTCAENVAAAACARSWAGQQPLSRMTVGAAATDRSPQHCCSGRRFADYPWVDGPVRAFDPSVVSPASRRSARPAKFTRTLFQIVPAALIRPLYWYITKYKSLRLASGSQNRISSLFVFSRKNTLSMFLS